MTWLRPHQRLTLAEAKRRALDALDERPAPAHIIADAIWPDHAMTNQGAGGAAFENPQGAGAGRVNAEPVGWQIGLWMGPDRRHDMSETKGEGVRVTVADLCGYLTHIPDDLVLWCDGVAPIGEANLDIRGVMERADGYHRNALCSEMDRALVAWRDTLDGSPSATRLHAWRALDALREEFEAKYGDG